MDITTLLPSAEVALALEPEELGAVIVELANRPRNGTQPTRFLAGEIRAALEQREGIQWPHDKRDAVMLAVHEAFAWLETVGLIMPDPSQLMGGSTQYRVLTRRGRAAPTRADVAAFREAGLLPVQLVHSSIIEKVHGLFLRGDHDVAVFQAFKAVEVAVREASGMSSLLGTALMRAAFHPDNGPLRDQAIALAEREAEMHLFSGAIGHAKNPGSHRDVVLSRPEAARLILLASYLLSIVEKRPAAFSRDCSSRA